MFFCSLALGYWIDYRARKHQEIEVMKRIYFGMIPVPWIFAGMLFLNGKFRTSHLRFEFRRLSSANLQQGACREAGGWSSRPGAAGGDLNGSPTGSK